MDYSQLETTLFQAAERRAAAHGMRLGDGAELDLRRFAADGAARILLQSPGANWDDPIVTESRLAFERLVDEMVRAGNEINGYRAAYPGIIGEQTLARALKWLCPLFPIC